jgi:sporulation protein YlmC with PRC-barrel domain
MTAAELRLEDLLGREVYARNHRRVGRIEELRARWDGKTCTIEGVVIGVAGLYERLGLAARLLAGGRRSGRVARWDQIDLAHPTRPVLTCALDELDAL